MFNSKNQPSKELYDTLQSTEFTQRYIEQNGFNLKDLEISKSRIQGVKITDFSLENMSLQNFDSRSSYLENGLFKDIEFDDVYFNESKITNVTFEDSNLTKVNFFGVNFSNVKFVNCKITQSTFYKLIDSDVEFINTEIYDNEYKFSESQIKMRLINSEFRDTDMMSLKEGSSIYVENSKVDNVSFQYSKLDYFKSVNSEVTSSTLANSKINQLTFEGGTIKVSFGAAVIDTISVTKSEIRNFGVIGVTANNISITDCNGLADVSLGSSKIDKTYISNCKFTEFHPSKIETNLLHVENSEISKSFFYKAQIKDLTLKNVTFTKELNMKKLQVENASLESVSKSSDLYLRDEGANIDFFAK